MNFFKVKQYTDSPMTIKKEPKLASNVKTSNFQVIEVASCDNKENIDVNLNRQLDFDTPEKVENKICKESGKQ